MTTLTPYSARAQAALIRVMRAHQTSLIATATLMRMTAEDLSAHDPLSDHYERLEDLASDMGATVARLENELDRYVEAGFQSRMSAERVL